MAACGAQMATQSGGVMGIPPTGKREEIHYTDFWRVRGGKLVDHWVTVDSPCNAPAGRGPLQRSWPGGLRRGVPRPWLIAIRPASTSTLPRSTWCPVTVVSTDNAMSSSLHTPTPAIARSTDS